MIREMAIPWAFSLLLFHPSLGNPPADPCNASLSQVDEGRGQPLLYLRQVVGDEIHRWEGTAGVAIPDEAKQEIQNEFVQNEQLLRKLLEKQKLSISDNETLIDSLVDDYLYDVRDGVIRKVLKNPKSIGRIGQPVANPTGKPSLPIQSAEMQSSSSVAKLDFKDFATSSVSSFLDHIAPLLEGDVGELIVSSKPDTAAITIDGKDRGFTNRKFVVSSGAHDVGTENPSCHHPINVPTNKTATFACPR